MEPIRLDRQNRMTTHRATIHDFRAALIEVCHYVDLYGRLPSDDMIVTLITHLTERHAVQYEYVLFGALTDRGRELLRGYRP